MKDAFSNQMYFTVNEENGILFSRSGARSGSGHDFIRRGGSPVSFIHPMLRALQELTGRTRTENGAATLLSTRSHVLDFFGTIGALREAPEKTMIDRFVCAYAEDPDLAMRTLFYARDIRGGLGERRVFRVLLRYLAKHEPQSVRKNLAYVAEMGRYDDLLVLLGTPCEADVVALIDAQLKEDIAGMERSESISLLAKWLPSVNTSCAESVRRGRYLARRLGMREAEYRRTLSRLRTHLKLLENYLRERNYTFSYEEQPSSAMLKYHKAFERNDAKRYGNFLEKAARGEATLHTSSLNPCDLVQRAMAPSVMQDAWERNALDVTWNALEDFTDDRNALCVVDTSGSMFDHGNPTPFAVAMSLGLYFAERNRGPFRGRFITFSHTPRLIEILGRDLAEKVAYCRALTEVSDTNIQAVFELILNAAVRWHLPQSQMPETIYIISDMEFNFCTQNASLTNFEYAKQLYASHHYRLPNVVFWNVQSRNTQQPVRMNERGVTLVGGYTPRLFRMVASGEANPYDIMMGVLGSERYRQICA